MLIYLDLVAALNFLVDFFLLLAANRLSGFPTALGRTAAAAGLGAVYAGACLLPGFHFLGNTLWRVVCLVLMGCCAFGWGKSAFRRCVLFVLLSMALGGVALGLGNSSFAGLTVSAALVALFCLLAFRGKVGSAEYVTVQLHYGSKTKKIIALRDTGNTLCDPVTGQAVLVVGADVAQELLGLSAAELAAPVETVASGIIPGLRLIPYRAVGSSCGMMVALRLEKVIIGKQSGSRLVAFAPEGLDREGTYQALTGGAA